MNGDVDILKYLLNATLTYNCKVKLSNIIEHCNIFILIKVKYVLNHIILNICTIQILTILVKSIEKNIHIVKN